MDNIDPSILEMAKRDFGPECELVKETEWSYSFKCGPKKYCRISRFLAEKNYAVSASEIRQRWPAMGESERLDLVSHFYVKDTWNDNDTEILEIIMGDGDDRLWENCALAFLKHPDRDRAVCFLIGRLQENHAGHQPLNYFQALGLLKDSRAEAAIRPYLEKYKKAMEAETDIGVPDDVFRGPIPYLPYLTAAGLSLRLLGHQSTQRRFASSLNTRTNKFDIGRSMRWKLKDRRRRSGIPNMRESAQASSLPSQLCLPL